MIYQGDIGVEFQVDVGEDCSAASRTQIKIKKPGGTTITRDASLDPSDPTILVYTSVSGDLDEVGMYYVQAYCEWSVVSSHHGELTQFRVYPVGV